MSLKKKIIIGFLISSVIILILVISAYVNFLEIRREIRYLELSDTVRTKTLQLRRYEKNFLLYGDVKESVNLHAYVKDLTTTLTQASRHYKTVDLGILKNRIEEYGGKFSRIEKIIVEFRGQFEGLKPSYGKYAFLFPVIESSFLEKPKLNAELLQKTFGLGADHVIIKSLLELDTEIAALRKNGEEILNLSNDLDKSARGKVEYAISVLEAASLLLFPLFLIVGIGTLFMISNSVVNRLKILTTAVQKAGKGDFSFLEVSEKEDEVGTLMTAFNLMKTDLRNRNIELTKKNEELHQARKLASIGTLASGVAHELNNPLNNIYISAQILEKETKDSSTPIVKEIVADIVGQTIRVKRIVGDLLEFARGREPRRKEIRLEELIRGAYRLVTMTSDTKGINFNLDADGVVINADPEQLERVFINLFTNAVDAMSGSGTLDIKAAREGDKARITIKDSGKGMPSEAVEKIFEPFYTTKDKGTGLGLAIAFNIIKRHAGEIRAESSEGKGTSFIITLPDKEVQ